MMAMGEAESTGRRGWRSCTDTGDLPDVASRFGWTEIPQSFQPHSTLHGVVFHFFGFGAEASLPRPRALLLPDEMDGAGAARRMRGEVLRRLVIRRRCRESLVG